ncbi:LysR family transcriptional regulator [Chitinasiproducens palmae]|uniref:DNA-binding transcriptional regulator, LysR family n=1 Tax=Chitinasiproducens palmae TaxID=1770053 RepID=A0A1H2PL98_9BURK|nr:LysR family transcriptional regulator [Chitinasiproducens palmae]SDV46842.1 DNA-binding transcriptional regulator, LysR family [Chitinasiproducens palmae]
MRVDVADLRLFRAVVEAGSMTAGAARVHRTLASVSERIKQMEEDVGVPLLSRGRGGVTPTEAGRVLLHHASKVLRQVDFMNDDLAQYTYRTRSNVRLHATTYAVLELLTQPISRFIVDCPDADVTVEEHLSEDVIHAVGNGSAEIGIVGHFVDAGGLETLPLCSDRLVAISAASASLAASGRVRFESLLAHDFVGLGRASRLQEVFEAHAREIGRPLRHRVQARNLDAICGLVAAGAGIAIVPQRIARRFAAMGLNQAMLDDEWGRYDATLCIKRRAALSSSAETLVAHLLACAGDTAA